ncbi:hypothetical protein D3C83_147240 [compost metagenome]
MVVRERLAPIRHREARVDRARLAERLGRIVELEAVHQQHAADEVRLRRGAARGGKRDAPEPLVRVCGK